MKHTLYIASIVLLLSCNSNPGEKEASTMLKNFYTEYMTEIHTGTSEEKLDSIKRNYCTTALLDSMEREFSMNELDYDPLLNGQDANTKNLKSLSITKDLENLNTYTVSYMDGYSKQTIAIHLRVIKEKDNFRIAGILKQ